MMPLAAKNYKHVESLSASLLSRGVLLVISDLWNPGDESVRKSLAFLIAGSIFEQMRRPKSEYRLRSDDIVTAPIFRHAFLGQLSAR
jgi:hypothetical protein